MYPEKQGYLSFEERMGCGIGACFACVCDTTEKIDADYVKVCSDGPVFPSGVVRSMNRLAIRITRTFFKKSNHAGFWLFWVWTRICKVI